MSAKEFNVIVLVFKLNSKTITMNLNRQCYLGIMNRKPKRQTGKKKYLPDNSRAGISGNR